MSIIEISIKIIYAYYFVKTSTYVISMNIEKLYNTEGVLHKIVFISRLFYISIVRTSTQIIRAII